MARFGRPARWEALRFASGRSVDLLKRSAIATGMDGVEGSAQAGFDAANAGLGPLRRQVAAKKRPAGRRGPGSTPSATWRCTPNAGPPMSRSMGTLTGRAVAAHRLQNGNGRWSTGASTSMRSTTLSPAQRHRGSRPSTSAARPPIRQSHRSTHPSSVRERRAPTPRPRPAR